jgi:hypothetical protein
MRWRRALIVAGVVEAGKGDTKASMPQSTWCPLPGGGPQLRSEGGWVREQSEGTLAMPGRTQIAVPAACPPPSCLFRRLTRLRTGQAAELSYGAIVATWLLISSNVSLANPWIVLF